nr:MAG: hypothetical protein [Bacteriophage sp.]
MINTKFEAYKLKRELKRSGKTYKIGRYSVNEYGEPIKGSINSTSCVGKFRGLYHEQNGYMQMSTTDTTQIISKKIPMIMCLYDDIKELNLKIDDVIMIGEQDKSIDFTEHRITGITNIQNWGIIADISLEPVEKISNPFGR